MRPYKEKYDIGYFGTDNPATPVAERQPFVVEFRKNVNTTPIGLPGTYDYVNIGIVESTHGTHVAGITAANDMLGNGARHRRACAKRLRPRLFLGRRLQRGCPHHRHDRPGGQPWRRHRQHVDQ